MASVLIPTLALTYTIGAISSAWVFSVECRSRPFSALGFVALGPVILAAIVVCSIVQGVYRQLWKRN